MPQRFIALFLALATTLAHAPAATAQVAAGTKLAVNTKPVEAVEGKLVGVSETSLTLSRKNSPAELERGLAALSMQAAFARPAVAGTKADKEVRFAERVRTGIAKLGTGPQARVEVRLRDKTKLKGHVREATADYFTVVDGAGNANRVAYPQVSGVKGHNLSEGARIAIVVGIVAAAVILAATVFAGS